MKKLISIALITTFNSQVFAHTIHQDYSPGSSSYRSGSTSILNVNRSSENEENNYYGKYDIVVSSLPSDPSYRWSGGYYAKLGISELPWKWEVSFDVYLNVAEPIKVSFECKNWTEGTPTPYPIYTYTYWVEPQETGWQSVTLNDSNVATITVRDYTFVRNETSLYIGLASHDASGNPLSISQIGTYSFLIDNVLMTGFDLPAVSTTQSTNGTMSIDFIGTLQSSQNLINWTSLDPQPESPFHPLPTEDCLFFRSIKE